MKLKRRKKNRPIITIMLIVLMTIIIINYIGDRITPRVEDIIKKNVNKSIYSYVFNAFNEDVFMEEDLLDVVKINMNSKEEIIFVDYNLNIAYKHLNKGIALLYNKINNLNPNITYYTSHDGVFFVPLGLINNNVLIENLGFKIPCKVNFITDIEINFKTRVSDYGMNNILVELYLIVNIENDLISPNSYEGFGENYEILVASKVIVGKIPNYYGGIVEKSSSIVSS